MLDAAIKENEALRNDKAELMNLGNGIDLYEYTQLKQEFEELMDKAEEYKSDATRLGLRTNQLKTDLKKYMHENKKLKTENQEYISDLQEKDNKIDELKQEILLLQTQNMNNNDIKEYIYKYSEEQRARKLAEETLDSKKAYFDYQLKEKQAEIQSLKSQLQLFNININNIQRPISARSSISLQDNHTNNGHYNFSIKNVKKLFTPSPTTTLHPIHRKKKRSKHKKSDHDHDQITNINRNSNGSHGSDQSKHSQNSQNMNKTKLYRETSTESIASTSSHQSNKSLNSISSYNTQSSTHPILSYHAYKKSNSALQATKFSVPRQQQHSIILSRQPSNHTPGALVNNALNGIGLSVDIQQQEQATETETDNESLYDVMEASREGIYVKYNIIINKEQRKNCKF